MRVLVANGDDVQQVSFSTGDGDRWDKKHKGFWLEENGGEYMYEYNDCTHWAHLPNPPEK